MLTKPWTDPRSIDWTQSPSPLTNPGWSANNNPWAYETLQEPVMQAIRNGVGIEPRIYVCPDPADQLIAARSTYDFAVPCDPNTWLWAINCSSSQGAGFYVQVTDSETGATVFSQPVVSQLLTGSKPDGQLILLSAPRLFVPPAYPVVRIVNNANAANVCTVNLFCCSELDLLR
jgi:hypothetical protein